MPDEAWRIGFLDPWNAAEQDASPDAVREHVYQAQEEAWARSLPHVVHQLPMKPTVMGTDSPHQTGDRVPYDMLTRAPLYCMTSHFTDIPPRAPVRGVHRHMAAPTLFCLSGRGWERNDGELYEFATHDLLVVPPYTIHQHGGDAEAGCRIYVPQSARYLMMLGAMGGREQHKLGEQPHFPVGTEPLRDAEGELVGYRILKGVLGIDQDIDVVLGPDPEVESVFQSRRAVRPDEAPAANTYDRYLQLWRDQARVCREATHVVRDADQPWEWTRQGRIKWLVHPESPVSSRGHWIYLQEVPPGSRSGRHRHVAEELILVLDGRGYDVHDGERWDWQTGDLIAVPCFADHQHVNTGHAPALLLHAIPSLYVDLGLGGIEQIEDAPEYAQQAPDRSGLPRAEAPAVPRQPPQPGRFERAQQQRPSRQERGA